MHPTAFDNCVKFYNTYLKNHPETTKVVDFGSYDVNGTLRPIFEKMNYTGIDMSEGPNVDVVTNNQSTPFENNSFDVVTSSSNFEHDDCFWVTFLEMCRIVKSGGYIYINAPSAGIYHGFPGDCWRFYADSWKALEKWANKNSYDIELVESYVDSGTFWCDSVGIFKKK
jgi:SAM-dependent methyltransferase